MPTPLIDTPEALDAAIADAVQARREKLIRIAAAKGARVWVAYACAAVVPLSAIVAFLAGDRAAARFLALESCLVSAFISRAVIATRRKAARELAAMKRA